MSAQEEVPLSVVCELAHGVAQDIADEVGVDLLHLKGAALDPRLSWPGRTFSDADVLVRPDHIARWLRALTARGWQVETSFEHGSPFAHAATMQHPLWGYLDVHRSWPGLDLSPAEAFDRLWSTRTSIALAALPCAVPQLVDQAVVQCLHAARSGHPMPSSLPAVQACWSQHDLRARVEARVEALRADVGYAVLTGTLDAYASHPDHALWVAISQPQGRVAEWVARVRRERSPVAAARMLGRAFLVNVEHLEVVLGHPPTRVDVAREFARRLRQAAVEVIRR